MIFPTVRTVIMTVGSLSYWRCCVSVIGALALSTIHGFQVEFTSTPTTLTYPLSDQFTLKCSLQHHSGIERDGPPESTTSSLQHITSIILTRGQDSEDQLASVTQYGDKPQKISQDTNLLQVAGNVSGLTDRGAYLELHWSHPDPTQADLYTCEINAEAEDGHTVVLSKTIRVQNVAPTVDQVARHVQTNLRTVEELQHKYHTLLARLDGLEELVQQRQDSMTQTVTTLQKGLDSADSKLRTLKTPHIETGHGDCGWSYSGWSQPDVKDRQKRTKLITGKFTQPYDKVPTVTAWLAYFDAYQSYNTRIGVYVVNVTRTDYTIACYTYFDSVVYGCFNWSSTNL